MARFIRPSNKQVYAIYYITARCNARCNFCSNWRWVHGRADQGSELTLDEIGALGRGLAPLYQLSISGGEPLLRQDLAEAAELLVRESGARTLSIPTNASLPERIAPVFERLLPAAPRTQVTVYVSMDGLGAVHDRIRGLPGLFDKALQSLEALGRLKGRFPNLLVYLNMTAQRDNLENLFEVMDFFAGNRAVDGAALAVVRGDLARDEIKAVDRARFRQLGRRYRRFLVECRPSLGQRARNAVLLSALDHIETYRRSGCAPLPCYAGDKLVVIGAHGELMPCELLDHSFGNLRETGFDVEALLDSETARRFRAEIRPGCACGWECGMRASVAFSPRAWPGAARNLFP